jgi:hypothetical protein
VKQIARTLIALLLLPSLCLGQNVVQQNITAGGNNIFYGTNQFLAPITITGTTLSGGTLTVTGGTAIPAIGIDPLAAPYNCKFDGVTDDSSCLQAAMTAAINANSCLILPAGQTAVFATTLTGNVGNKGSCVRGKGLQPSISGFSVLKYTGAGSAVSFSNSNAFIFGVNWDSVVIMAGANATSSSGHHCNGYVNQSKRKL